MSFVSSPILAKSPTQTPVIININKADISTLQLLKGVGEIRAKSIVAYRKKNGVFKAVNDLSLIKGISKKIIAKNINSISLTKGLTTIPAKKTKRTKRKVKPKKEQVKNSKQKNSRVYTFFVPTRRIKWWVKKPAHPTNQYFGQNLRC